MKIIKTIFLVSVLVFVCTSPLAKSAKAEDVNVGTTIDSRVSKDNSQITLSTTETLADPSSHPVLLTIIILDKNGIPLPKKEVIVTSNRGKVDTIEAVSKISAFLPETSASEISPIQEEKSDEEGKVSFRISSFMPGQVVLKIVADSVELKSQTIIFEPRPFTANVTIAVYSVILRREFIIFAPKLQEQELSAAQIESKKLINPETKITIYGWTALLVLLIIFGTPFLLLINFINLRKMRKYAKQDSERLKLTLDKILSAQDINALKSEIHKDGLGSKH